MAERVIKLPDVGEGVAEAELVEWRVKVGDLVREDDILAAVMTDKATVEIPSPVDGEVIWIGGAVGDTLAVGSPLIRLKTGGEDAAPARSEVKIAPPAETKPPPPAPKTAPAPKPARARAIGPRPEGERPLASPAVRHRAREAGVDLRLVAGTGPASRIEHADLEAFLAGGAAATRPGGARQSHAVEEIKLVGLRRKISEKMMLANRVPHITYVEEVDVTALEALRGALNAEKRPGRTKLTLLPFLMRAMIRAIADQPSLNATFDDEAGVLTQYGAVHVGIATQTASGLVVAVVRHAEALDLWDCAAEIARLADAARTGAATREDLGGSTITITSLGAMGGVATTPILNHPEVAIVGVNKIVTRPVWDGAGFTPRKMMNLSSSFDHRIVDGWNAAVFVQRVKSLLETPAMLFIEG